MVHASELIVIGSKGFIGSHFCRAFPGALPIDRSQLDLRSPRIDFPTEGRTVAVIAAGIGNPRKCEVNPAESYQCNVVGTIALGKELLKRGIQPIFFSTDYVLDDALRLAPLNTYGRHKAELEAKATELGALVVRLSKVYGVEKGDGTLFDEMAGALIAGKKIRAAIDQIFSPLFVGDLIERVAEWHALDVKGVVTAAGPIYASRLEMAYQMCEKLNVSKSLVESISLDELQDGVNRPKKLMLKGNFPALTWQEGIERVVQAYECVAR